MNEKEGIVLLGENKEAIDNSVKILLNKLNFEVLEYTDGIEAVRKSFEKGPDLIILDITIPRMNGYQCTRLLKNDQVMKDTAIILLGSSRNPIEQYWSKVSGADAYLGKPVKEKDFKKILGRLLPKKTSKHGLLPPASMIRNMEDHSILSMAANLLEEELIQANILNEISMIDIFEISIKDLVIFVMKIIESLYNFSQGVVLLIYERHSELFFYQDPECEKDRMENTKKLIFNHLQQKYGLYIDPETTKEKCLQKNMPIKKGKKRIDDIYIHTRGRAPIRSLLAFTKIGFKKRGKADQEKLNSTLDLAREVLEKKVYFEMTQEFSIIDIVTGNYSLAFLMTVLDREMKNSKRHGYSITLFTICISNFEEITKNTEDKTIHDLIFNIQHLILRTTRKIDIVARWDTASFAFLFTYTSIEGARVAQERINKFIIKNVSQMLSSSTDVRMDIGISQFNPDRDHTPAEFFAHALPEQARGKDRMLRNLNFPQSFRKFKGKNTQGKERRLDEERQ